jgi:protein DJ-1
MKQTAPKRTADGIMLPRTDRDDLDDALPAPRAIVLLAEGAEEIEVVVPIDILRRGGVEVVVAGLSQSGGPVRCGRGVVITPDVPLHAAVGPFDVVILPGGLKGAERLAASTEVGRLLRTQVEQMGLVAAICAAPIALVRHQVFAGRAMTCHPSVKETVGAFGALRGEATLVEDGELITASGAGASFSFALTILRRLQGEGSLPAVTAPMTFDHTPELPPYLQP